MNAIIMKFGGSSLASPEKIMLAAGRAAVKKRAGFSPVVVVSAPGDVTDDLIKLSAEITGDPQPREYDALINCGEQISAALTAMALKSCGCDAVSLTGAQAGIFTDSSFLNAGIKKFDCTRIESEISADKIPVITGFQGVDCYGNITTLGRGGSDLTAVLVAAGLHAGLCEFYTDVKGIYTAHPAVVPEAERLPELSYGEVLTLAALGTEVRQMRAVKYAEKQALRLSLRSSFTDDDGTVISAEIKRGIKAFSLKKNGDTATVSAIGAGLNAEDFKIFDKAAEGFPVAETRYNQSFISTEISVTEAEKLLKRLHRNIIERT